MLNKIEFNIAFTLTCGCLHEIFLKKIVLWVKKEKHLTPLTINLWLKFHKWGENE